MTPAEVRERLTPAARRRAWCLRVTDVVCPMRLTDAVIREPSDKATTALVLHLELARTYARRVVSDTPELDAVITDGWALLGRCSMQHRGVAA